MRHVFLSSLLFLAACGSGSSSTDDDEAGDQTEPGGPRLLSFGTNSPTLNDTAGAKLVISAVLTDPDGVDDIVGGSLIDPVSAATYGTFATGAQEGAYSIELDWDAFNSVDAIETTTTQPVTMRMLEARFFDQAGHQATKSLTVGLTCADSDEGEYATDGSCDLLIDSFGCDSGCTVDVGHGGAITGRQACDMAQSGSPCERCVFTSPESCDSLLDRGARCFCDSP